jgi:hypothetical protein
MGPFNKALAHAVWFCPRERIRGTNSRKFLYVGEKAVYRDDGLAVCFSKYLPRHQLNVDVWQIYFEGKTPSDFKEVATENQNAIYYVGGHKPKKLEGSQNDLIRASWDLKK